VTVKNLRTGIAVLVKFGFSMTDVKAMSEAEFESFLDITAPPEDPRSRKRMVRRKQK
jgi:hypothetical protein